MFADRADAAGQLTALIIEQVKTKDAVVLAVPRGGLPIGAAVATALKAPLDVILTKKIGAPGNPEFAIGAVTEHGYFVDPAYDTQELGNYLRTEIERIQELLAKRAHLYRQGRSAPILRDKVVIIVDDGVATGRTLIAALNDVAQQQPRHIIIATPVITPDARELLHDYGARVISVLTPEHLQAIGQFYYDFSQVSDEEAIHILHAYHQK